MARITAQGFIKASYLQDAAIDEFLERVANGEPIAEACAAVGTSVTQMNRRLRSDEGLNDRYEIALREGHGSLFERVRSTAWNLALKGEWQAIKFLLISYGDDFAWARSQRVQVDADLNLQAVAGVLAKHLDPGDFDQVVRMLEAKEAKELPVESAPQIPAAA
jgi:hypothetical protein